MDIGGPFHAVLNSLAFEGATRRNRPKLDEGDLVYARVTLAHKDVDTELSCTEVSGKVCLILWIPVLQGSPVDKASCTVFCDLCPLEIRLGLHTRPWGTHECMPLLVHQSACMTCDVAIRSYCPRWVLLSCTMSSGL